MRTEDKGAIESGTVPKSGAFKGPGDSCADFVLQPGGEAGLTEACGLAVIRELAR